MSKMLLPLLLMTGPCPSHPNNVQAVLYVEVYDEAGTEYPVGVRVLEMAAN